MDKILLIVLALFACSCGGVQAPSDPSIHPECESACEQWYQWAESCDRSVPCSITQCVDWLVDNDCNDPSGYESTRCLDALMQIPDPGDCWVPEVGSCWPLYCED